MTRMISFSQTVEQMYDGTKDVTRRIGWLHLSPGDILIAVEKAQGLRRGEHVRRIGPIRVVSARWEALRSITPEDVVREGFPTMTPAEFVDFFCEGHKCDPLTPVNRIEFERLYKYRRNNRRPDAVLPFAWTLEWVERYL